MNLTHLSEEELLSGVRSLSVQDRVIGAKLLAYLAEVEARGLHRDRACATLCQYCIRELGMSEDEAWRRASAASVVREYPIAIGMLERGETSLTNLLLLKPHLKTAEDEELLLESAKMSKLEVQELLASHFPRPDVPTSIAPVASEALPLVTPPAGPATAAASPPARIEPLSPARFRLEGTIDADVRDLLGEVRDLMSHSNPSGDLNVVLKYALTLAKKDLEKKRFAKTDKPQKSTKPSTRRGSVPRATRRFVFERDGYQCTYVDDAGCRCPERKFLQLDHLVPRAKGGTDDAENLATKCRAHNLRAAEKVFGRAYVEKKKREKKEKAAAKTEPPRQRGADRAMALDALVRLGFKTAEAKRALDVVDDRFPNDAAVSIQMLLLEAIRVLS